MELSASQTLHCKSIAQRISPVPTESKLSYIDSLRGIAILIVILSHTAQRISGEQVWLNKVIGFGSMGVQLFFILSAITLCMSHESRSGEPKQMFCFYLRRFFRIAPMYYVGIIIYGVYHFCHDSYNGTTKFESIYSWDNVLMNVTFLNGFYPKGNNNVVPGGWSIGTEMAFYAVFPFLYVWYIKLARRHPLMVYLLPFVCLLLSAGMTSTIQHAGYFQKGRFLYFNLVNQLPCFFLGISYYLIVGKNRREGSGSAWLLSFLLIASIAISTKQYNLALPLHPFVSCLAFICLIEGFRRTSFLNRDWLIYIGRISYSMYVIHFFFAWYLTAAVASKYLEPNLPPFVNILVCFAVSVMCSVALSHFTEKCIEKSGIQLGKRVINLVQAHI